MLLAREGDLRENLLVRQGRGSFQLSGAGHEAVAALAPHVDPDDLVFPAYRDRALMHALGMSVEEMARDFFAREGSSSGGRNLPGHFSSRRLNVFSITSPVGAQCLSAVGAAWAYKLEGKPSVALCHIGDAATRQGEFFEAIAQAVQDRLPVVFVVEDNGYGISTPTLGKTPLAFGMIPEPILVRVDGRDAERVFLAGEDALTRARRGDGPSVLWLDLDRLGSHTNADDHRTYRSLAEIDSLAAGDPLDILSARLVHEGVVTPEEWKEIRQEVVEQVRAAYARVEREPAPRPDDVERHLFGPPPGPYPPIPGAGPVDTMLRAANGTLRVALASDPKVVVFGEDIEDPKGGVFGITKGLSTDYPSRVVNSPLAEATIVGMGVGLAAAGMRPIFELQFIDFVGPAMNALMAQAANLRWRTLGDWTCPLVLVAPSGAYLPGGGMWHSGSNEGLLANIPGLRLAVPSTPEDAAGLLWAAAHDDDPSLVLLPKHLLRAPCDPPVPAQGGAVRWGVGRVVREGADATVVAWGNCVEVAAAAADALASEAGIRVEIIDPRTLVPLDWALIADSVGRTGRLVVVQEDTRTCGFGQAIVAEMTARPDRFAALRAAPVLVARPDVPVPFATGLESALLPSPADVVRAVRSTLTRAEPLLSPLHAEVETGDDGLVTLTVPQLGEGLRHVRVTALLKNPGDAVALDEPLYEVETDKANVVVESSVAGTLSRWCVELGQEAEVHGPVAILLPVGAPIPQIGLTELPSALRSAFEEFPVTDRQRAMNRSALGGRLDVPLPASVGRPLPWHLVEEARARLRHRYPRLRMTEFGVFAFAAARATQEHPKFRSSLVERGETVRRYAHVDLGFAIALPEDELATAVVREADALSFEGFAEEMRSRHKEAKTGLSQSDARTTLLISSLAGHDVTDAAPVLFPPAIATLFVGAPHGVDGNRKATLRLAFDHRLINGVGAAGFLQGIERELEGFGREI